eukprot:3927538-Prymnesium_polylepis.1
MAGACWVLPEFAGRVGDVEMISTLKSRLAQTTAEQKDGADGRTEGGAQAFRDLWGVGGALNMMARKTASRSQLCGTGAGGLADEAL